MRSEIRWLYEEKRFNAERKAYSRRNKIKEENDISRQLQEVSKIFSVPVNQIKKTIKRFKSELEIKNKIVVAKINKNTFIGNLLEMEKEIRKISDVFYSIEGTKVFTVFISEKYVQDLERLFDKNIIKISKELAMITIKSPKDLENTLGVNAFIF